MYLFLNSANIVIFKKLKQYKVILINPSARPTPTNKLYCLKNGDKNVEIIFIIKNPITAHCILFNFISLKIK